MKEVDWNLVVRPTPGRRSDLCYKTIEYAKLATNNGPQISVHTVTKSLNFSQKFALQILDAEDRNGKDLLSFLLKKNNERFE